MYLPFFVPPDDRFTIQPVPSDQARLSRSPARIVLLRNPKGLQDFLDPSREPLCTFTGPGWSCDPKWRSLPLHEESVADELRNWKCIRTTVTNADSVSICSRT